MTDRITDFEAGPQHRHPKAPAAGEPTLRRPTQYPPQQPPAQRPADDRREPASSERDASAAGLAAGRAGVPSLANPYPIADQDSSRWHAAWMRGQVGTPTPA